MLSWSETLTEFWKGPETYVEREDAASDYVRISPEQLQAIARENAGSSPWILYGFGVLAAWALYRGSK